MKKDVDDVGFIEAVVAEIGTGLELDRQRIFATGMSNGGIMAYRLACESDLFAAIAPVAGDDAGRLRSRRARSRCCTSTAVSTASVPPDGSPGGGTQNIDGPPLADVIAYWRGVDGCGCAGTSPYGDDPRVTITAASDCDDAHRGGATSTISDAGHQWPGVDVGDPRRARRRPAVEAARRDGRDRGVLRAHPRSIPRRRRRAQPHGRYACRNQPTSCWAKTCGRESGQVADRPRPGRRA